MFWIEVFRVELFENTVWAESILDTDHRVDGGLGGFDLFSDGSAGPCLCKPNQNPLSSVDRMG